MNDIVHLKDTIKERPPSNKTQALTKSMSICTFGYLVHQINSLKVVLILKENFQKIKLFTGKTPFFVIGPFYTPHSICLNIGF